MLGISKAKFRQSQGTVLQWDESVTEEGQRAGKPVGGVFKKQGESERLPGA